MKGVKNFQICYAVKANPNLGILNMLSRMGSGFDVVSGGEIARCLAAGVEPSKIIFSGCGKSDEEIKYAVKSNVHCINVESWEELDRIEMIAAKLNKVQNVSIRVNPDLVLDGHSHPNILTGAIGHKFGVPISEGPEIYSRAKASSSLKIKGISCHLGSNIHSLEPYIEARDKLLHLADELRQESRICIEHIDLGGGFPIQSSSPDIPDVSVWIEKLAKPILDRGLKLVLEPGRSIIADAGVLLAKVEYVKTMALTHGTGSGSTSPRSGSFVERIREPPMKRSSKTFAILDAGFNDFARTALYGAHHPMIPTLLRPSDPALGLEFKYDITGPVCETTDVFHKDFVSAQRLIPGDLVIFGETGAYGASMASNYNTRNKPAEVLINDGRPVLVAERENYEQQFKREKVVADLKVKTLKIEEGDEEDVNNNVD